MPPLYLRLRAPFGAFRTSTLGTYRPTFPSCTPSAAFGIAMRLAGLDARDPEVLALSCLREVSIAVGDLSLPGVGHTLQWHHLVPVGPYDKSRKEIAKGSRPWVSTVTYEVLVGLDLVLGVQGGGLPERILDHLEHGTGGGGRVPCAGDAAMMFDSIEPWPGGEPVDWWSVPPDGLPCQGSIDMPRFISHEAREPPARVRLARVGWRNSSPEQAPEQAWVRPLAV